MTNDFTIYTNPNLWSHLHAFKTTNLTNLKTLKIIGKSHSYNEIQDMFGLNWLTNHFSDLTLEYIEINCSLESIASENQCDYEYISKLKGFAISNEVKDEHYTGDNMNNFMRNIYGSLGANLPSFHKGKDLPITKEIDGKLNNVQELCISLKTYDIGVFIEDMKRLLNQNMNQVKRVHIADEFVSDVFVDEFDAEKEVIKLLLNKIIKNVNYIALDMDSISLEVAIDILIE